MQYLFILFFIKYILDKIFNKPIKQNYSYYFLYLFITLISKY